MTNHGEGLPPGDGERALSKCDNHAITLLLKNCQHPVSTADYINVDCKPLNPHQNVNIKTYLKKKRYCYATFI